MLTALTTVWGTTFALTQNALHDVSPIFFAALRFGLATILFLAISKASRDGLRVLLVPKTDIEKKVRRGSILLGIALGLGYIFQFIGLLTTTTSKSAFITSTTVIWTPLIALVVSRARFHLITIVAILLSVVGIVLLMHPFPVEEIVIGDIWTLLCAFSFGIYIFQLDRVMPLAMQYEKSELASVLMISSVQLIVGFICIVVVLPFAETPRIVLSGQMIFALLYTTILATAVSIYVQAMYQKEISPTSAVLIYTLEPVAAVIIAYIFMNERFTVGEWAGAALIVGGMMLGQMRGKE